MSSQTIRLSVSRPLKTACVIAAKGQPLSKWCIAALSTASGYQVKDAGESGKQALQELKTK